MITNAPTKRVAEIREADTEVAMAVVGKLSSGYNKWLLFL